MSEKLQGFLVASAVIFVAFIVPLLADNSEDGYTTPEEDYSAVEPISETPEKYVESEYTSIYGESDCTEDCSGHSAGYEWAQDNDVCDPDFDGGNSESFAEGVQAYAWENCYYND